MKKVNYYAISKELSNMVSTYMFRFVWQNEVRATYSPKIAYYRLALDDKNTTVKGIDEKPLTREQILSRIDDLENEMADILSAKWRYENDKDVVELKNACRGAESADVKKAITTFLAHAGMDSENATRIVKQAIIDCGSSMNCRVLVQSDGTKVRKFNANKALSCTMAILFEEMVQAGTIRPVQIPSLLRDKYGKKEQKGKKNTTTTTTNTDTTTTNTTAKKSTTTKKTTTAKKSTNKTTTTTENK